MRPVDEAIFRWIGDDVDHAAECVLGLDALDDGGLLVVPDLAPSAVMHVDALGEELVKVAEEVGEFGEVIGVLAVEMVALGDERVELDTVVLGGDAEAVEDGLVGLLVRAEKKLPQDAAAGGEDGSTFDDGT